HEMAKQEHWDKDNIRFLFADILENKNRLNREVLDVLREELANNPGFRFKLCANLPYQIATPLMSNLLLTDIPPHSMTVTIQKEVGDRIVARPRTKDYGALAVWMQAQCDCRIVRIMPPSVFWPRPKVDSAIVQCVYNEKKRAKIPNLKFFHEFVRALFFHRRKFIRSVLCSAFKGRVEKETVDRILAEMNLEGEIRAETLSVKTILALSEKFRVLFPPEEAFVLR
ncbi:MAG: ribosomal RNA small subunit methyltransferase A, partial [Thermoguttaceae bacterium]|nr:ribosomal RNA small subunit methyltransferase A [Thermoguttaceae bacterium]